MTQNNIIVSAIVVLLLLLGFWHFSGSKTSGAAGENQKQASLDQSAKTTVSAFHSIFIQPGSHQCSYAQVTTGGQANSVIYIADGKMRGEFRTTGAVTDANLMIYSGGTLYSWKEGASVGVKSSIKSLSDLPQVIPADLTSGAIFGVSNENVGWDCHDWAKDPSIFDIPSYVKFS